jgi:hypothetical protein
MGDINALNLIKKKQEEERQQQATINNPNILQKALGTTMDTSKEISKGFFGVFEGIADLGATGIGSLADVLGNKDLSKQMQDFVKPQYVNDFMDNTALDLTRQVGLGGLSDLSKQTMQNSYLNNLSPETQQIVRGVANGLGQALPMIITGGLASGTSLAGATAKGVTTAQALAKAKQIGHLAGVITAGLSAGGKGSEKALNEGANIHQALGYGVTSGLSEGAIEYFSGMIGGNVIAGLNLGGSGGKALGKIVRSSVGEGLEEVASDLIDPVLENIYKDTQYSVNANELGKSFIIGSLSSAILSGANVTIDTLNYGVKGNKVNGYLQDIQELVIEKDTKSRKGKLSLEESQRIDTEIDNIYGKILEVNDNMSEKDMEHYESQLGKSYQQTLDMQQETNEMHAYRLNKAQTTQPKQLVFKPAQVETMPKEQSSKIDSARQTINAIQSKTNSKVEVVFTDDMQVNENGAYKDGVIYVNVNSKNPVQTVLKHELTHSIENTKSYTVLKDIIVKELKANGTYTSVIQDIGTRYASNVQNMNEQAKTEYLEQELVAETISEKMFSDEQFIKVLAKEKPTLARKILTWIKNKIKSLTNNTEVDFLKKAETLYSQALEENNTQVKLANDTKLSKSAVATLDTPTTQNQDIDEATKQKVSTQTVKEKQELNLLDINSIKQHFKSFTMKLMIETLDTGIGIKAIGRQANVNLSPLYNYAQTSTQASVGTIENGVFDPKTGKQLAKSPKEIMKPILVNENLYREWQNYAFHKHNINRMNIRETLSSRKLLSIVEEYLMANKGANVLKLQDYLDSFSVTQIKPQLLDQLVADNTISQSLYDFINEKITTQKTVFGKFLTKTSSVETALQDMVNIGDLPMEFLQELKDNGNLSEGYVNKYIEDNPNLKAQVVKYLKDNLQDVTSADSQRIVGKYDNTNPNFEKITNDLVQYFRELLKLQLNAGMISQEQYDYFIETYPNYIPTYRVFKKGLGSGTSSSNSGASVSSIVKKATGSDLVLEPIGDSVVRQTNATLRATRINMLATKLYELKLANPNIQGVEIVQEVQPRITDVSEIDYDSMIKTTEETKDYTITFFVNGETKKMKVADTVYQGFFALTPNGKSIKQFKYFEKVMQPVMTTFKRLATSLRPLFSFYRNPEKDFQNAILQTQFGGENLIKNTPRALDMIRKNDTLWQIYQAEGGMASSVMDFNNGLTVDLKSNPNSKIGRIKSRYKLVTNKVERASRIFEQIFRFTEFVMTMESTNGNVQQAIYNSSEVTTNFNTQGHLVGWLNRNVAPFINPVVQGSSKFVRTVATRGTPFRYNRQTRRLYVSKQSFRQYIDFITQWALFGVGASLLNELLLGDDDEYKSLRDSDKDTNYIFKVGNSFFKIPKGQVTAVVGSISQRVVRYLKGEETAFDGYLKNASLNMNPVDNFRFIWQPFEEIKSNTTWYGGTIENQSMQNLSPKQRYDESTSSIAVTLGQALNYSPKKIHYILDQYSGVIGNIILPMTTPKAEGSGLAPLQPIRQEFSIDPIFNNKYSTQFYDLKTKTTYKKNDNPDSRDSILYKAKLRYLNKVDDSIGDINKDIKKIQSNKDLSDTDKINQVKVLKALINSIQKEALISSRTFETNLKDFELSDVSYEEDYRNATRLTFGADVALEQYSKDTYDKATALNTLGLDYEYYYDIYFDLKDIKESVDSSIRKDTVFKYINKIKASKSIKYLVYAMQGYSLTDTQKQFLKSYLNSTSKLSLKEKQFVLQYTR